MACIFGAGRMVRLERCVTLATRAEGIELLNCRAIPLSWAQAGAVFLRIFQARLARERPLL